MAVVTPAAASELTPLASAPARAWGVLAQSGALVAAGLGLAALLGWLLGLPLISSLDRHWVNMSPVSALLFAQFGAGLFCVARWPDNVSARRAATGAALIAAMVSGLLLLRYLTGIRTGSEHLGFALVGAASGAEVVRMSPVSAASLLLCAASLLVSLSDPSPRRIRTGFWLACLIIAVGAFFILAYLFGRPLLYGEKSVPPAAATSLAFVALGIALAAFAAPRARRYEEAIDEASRRLARRLGFILAALATALIAVGYFYVTGHEAQYRERAGRELSAISDLKVGELALWRAERLADAAVYFRHGAFSDLVRRAFAAARDKRAQEQLSEWLGHLRDVYHYDQVFLLDAEGDLRVSASDQLISAGTIERASVGASSDRVVFLDFHRDDPGEAAHLALLVPIFDQENAGRRLGLLYLGINPQDSLYPLIERWPTPSKSAEALLVRRDGEEVLYLNGPKFHQDAAPPLRIPLTRTDVLAVKAVLGQEGIVEGLHYRGAPAMASLRKVPDSPWFLVAHIETAEAMAPAYESLWLTTGLVATLLLAAAAATGFAWRQQRVRHYKDRLRAAEALVTERKRAEESAKAAHEQLRQLAIRLNSKHETESGLLSRELHDEFGQILTSLKMDLSWLAARMVEGDPELKEKVASSLDLVDSSVKSVRSIAARLRPRILDELGLLPAIDWLVQDFRERTGIDTDFVADAQVNWLSPEQSTALFRIVQESLSNISRHADAKCVDVVLDAEAGFLRLEIRDDGRGVREDEKTSYESIGLLGMRERALAAGGELTLESVHGKGTVVTLRLPLATAGA